MKSATSSLVSCSWSSVESLAAQTKGVPTCNNFDPTSGAPVYIDPLWNDSHAMH